MRIVYLASSKEIVSKIAHLRSIMDVQGDNMMEQAMLQLINDGHIKRHLKRATLFYKTKRDFFEKVITEHLSDKINFINQKAVSHFGWYQNNQQIWFLYRNYFYRKVFKLYRLKS